ncbi:MAG: glycosyltransferase family 39 protein, partial [Pirellulales bacterium]|nr:glycosyltransferase family 39 protein [Pirellulales bacterium]
MLATIAVLATLQPGQTGPGVTCDELYYVMTGKAALTTVRHEGLSYFWKAGNWRDLERKTDEPPVHPPLGCWILGGVHHLFDGAPDDIRSISISGGRFAPALALGMLCFLVGITVVRREGPLAGTVAAAAVALAPRVFGHAHLAALDMLTTFFFVAAVLAVSEAEARGGHAWQFGIAGVVWGLTMLVRLHGVLLLPPVAAWTLWQFRHRAATRLAAW